MQKAIGRFRPRHPLFGAAASQIALPFTELFFRWKQIYRSSSHFAAERRRELAAKLARGETAYLAGISIGGFHNSGVALIEVTPDAGLRIICNNEEERFSGRKHANHYPGASLEALTEHMERLGIKPEQIVAWLATYDFPLLVATGARSLLEEFPASMHLMSQDYNPTFDGNRFKEGMRAPTRLGQLLGLVSAVPIIGVPHHDTHAWFSYLVSPFARDTKPVMIAVIEGSGDFASVSMYLGVNGAIKQIGTNGSIFDSLGMFYSVISSTQGGWTVLSSEGRYMGAAAYGDMNRSTNRFYSNLRDIFSLDPNGDVRINRSIANWHRDMLREPYTPELISILGPPISPENMWNPDAVLRVEDIHHRPDTQERLDKAAATQMVFEDALIHIIDGLIRTTGSDRLVLTGGAALNAVANMRLLEKFDEGYYSRIHGRATRLHLWVPPVPGDAGATVGAAYAFAASVGAGFAPPLQHAFYCGRASSISEILDALESAAGVAWFVIGKTSNRTELDAIADLMAFITARDGIIGIFQGSAETGPRALGHRSIVANACNPRTRDLLNERVKYREPIRPLAPMATLAAAKDLFELSEGASDDNYNAYNYMVLTARAKPHARQKVPAVIHADGTARLQIVREHTDALTYAYLKALGRRIGVEVAVNTSFNVAAPIAQSPAQALDTLRRAIGMDGVFIFSDDGSVVIAWAKDPRTGVGGRIRKWVVDWRLETGVGAEV
ncbi:MAG: carbamoyltransferase C-terminal domain-containing protein [Beijerinckiaceae bacterium]